MNIGWPEGIWIGLTMASLLLIAAQHGCPRDGKHNFALAFMAALINIGLLYWGGFFA